MRRRISRSVRTRNNNSSQPKQQRRSNNQASCSQYQHIQNALETLDNHHALALLKTYQELTQKLHCLRTALAHQLDQHQLCMLFAKKALQYLPKCKSCLTVYLSHPQQIPPQDIPLKEELLSIFQDEVSELFQFIPKIVSLTPNYSLYTAMTNNLKQIGGELQKIRIVEVSSGRKIIALEKIFRNEQILFVPKSHLITLELAKELPSVQKLLQSRAVLRSPKHTQLAIFLLEHFELGIDSPFASYLNTLPSEFSHFPVNYTQNLLEELKGTCFLEQVNQKKQDMRKDYQAILLVDQSFSRFQFKKFVEARLLVSSRVFGIVVDQVKTDALVPIADMLNHKLPKQTSWFYCNNKQGFVIQSLKQISPGCEVFDSYGQKCNSRFLLNYGFVLLNNPHNQIPLEIDLTNLFHGLPRSTKIRVSKSLQSKGFEEVLGLLRANLDYSQSAEDSQQEGNLFVLQNFKQTPFKTVQLQIRVWKIIEEIISERMKEYPQTVLEDKKILKNCEDTNKANIVILRKGQKEVLSFYLTMSKRINRYLQSGGKRGDIRPYQTYITNINAFGHQQPLN